MFRNLRISQPPINSTRMRRSTLGEMRRLFAYLRPYRLLMAVAITATLIGSGIGLIFPLFIQDLINTVFASGTLQQLSQITLILIGAFLLRAVFYYLQSYYLAYIGERIVVDLRSQVYSHLQVMSVRFFTDRRIGELVSRLSSDVTVVRTALTNNVATVLSQTVTFIGSLVLMLFLNWQLTLFILILAPLLIASAALFGLRLRRLSTVVQDQLAESTAIAEESLSNVRVVKAFNRESYEAQRYDDQIRSTFHATMQANVWRSSFGALVSFLGFASLAMILWFGGREVLAGRLSSGSLIAFLIYGINIAASLGSFTALYTQLQEAAGATSRIFELIDEEPDIAEIPQAIALPYLSGHIQFQTVTFAYPGSQHVLHGIDLEIQPGEVLALVGPSGAGKSTLFNLIPRFYDPTSGLVQIDGYDLRQISLSSLRGQIGYVPQETQLFSGTILDNLRYGKLEASDDEIEEAVRAANAEEFILNLAEGYRTVVGERGVKLSGGQRQRIAIARAILKDPRILLLDEATSSLDSESESLVQEALDRLMVNRTTVIIAHRLSTVHRADRIAVLEAGHLIELGSHSELMALDGLYARLYRMQFRNHELIEPVN
jgi:subfamily B ATP-binding cassette protein MsbA